MAIGISKRIRNIYHSLSKGHKRIANIVLREPEKVKDYTYSRLAMASEVSESTVFRFIKAAGYDGYYEFKQAIIDELQSCMDHREKIVKPTSAVMCSDLVEKTLTMDAVNIKFTSDHLDLHSFNDIVDLSINSKRKYIIAFGNDVLPAKLLYDNFVAIFENVTLITQADDYFAILLSLTRHDQVIIFSISNKSNELQGLTKYIKNKGANVIVFADMQSSYLAEYADHLVIAKADTPSFNESFSSAFSLVNALTLEIVRKDRIRVTQRYKMIQKLRDDFSK
jgi:DNA-binding MurR/RpiR family transcriptional regulator